MGSAKQGYKWGIMGTGRIATLFTQGLETLDTGFVYAVGSRNQGTADAFAAEHNIAHAYGSYASLLADPQVEIIYIGTPHSEHFQNAWDALQAGKHVLCEKAFTLNARQAGLLVDLAREKELFLMEAMWNRFQPWYQVVRRLLEEGRIGDLYHLKADLSFRFDVGPEHRIHNPALGGGALLDLGVYPISFASLFLGKPSRVMAAGHRCNTGVDDQVAMLLNYPSGATAALACSTRYLDRSGATLYGSRGMIEIHGLLGRPDHIIVREEGQAFQKIDTPHESNGYQYQAQAVMDMLSQNQLEHPLMTLAETVEIMRTMDQIRDALGVVYPGE